MPKFYAASDARRPPLDDREDGVRRPILSLAGMLLLLRVADPRAALADGYAFGLGWFLAKVA